MLPMVAVGTGSVALLYRLVKRDFGVVAGTIAALTPPPDSPLPAARPFPCPGFRPSGPLKPR